MNSFLARVSFFHHNKKATSLDIKKKKKNILSSKFKILQKIVNRRKERKIFSTNNLRERDGRSQIGMLVGPRFRLSFFARQQQCKIYRILRQSVPLSHDSSNETLNGRIASVNLILNDTPAQRRGSPDRGNESNLLNIASDDDKRHGYGIPRFPPYSRKCLNFVLNIINCETYDNNSLGDSFVKSYL